jgi:hypothetical protein
LRIFILYGALDRFNGRDYRLMHELCARLPMRLALEVTVPVYTIFIVQKLGDVVHVIRGNIVDHQTTRATRGE